jgi:hypothetical protein
LSEKPEPCARALRIRAQDGKLNTIRILDVRLLISDFRSKADQPLTINNQPSQINHDGGRCPTGV